MYKLMPRRAEAIKRLCHKLMDVLPFLVSVQLPVTEFLDSSATRRFHVTIDVSSKSTREASGRTSLNDLKQAVSRMLWPQCYGQAS
jgi:hypothetical protein